VILGGLPSENVILLELHPHEQKTRIDFYCTQDYLGIQPVCLTELIQEGRKLYYVHALTGKRTEIRRIYNRVIFDELNAAGLPGNCVDISRIWTWNGYRIPTGSTASANTRSRSSTTLTHRKPFSSAK